MSTRICAVASCSTDISDRDGHARYCSVCLPEVKRRRAAEWYEANRARKLDYQKAYGARLTAERTDEDRARHRKAQRAYRARKRRELDRLRREWIQLRLPFEPILQIVRRQGVAIRPTFGSALERSFYRARRSGIVTAPTADKLCSQIRVPFAFVYPEAV